MMIDVLPEPAFPIFDLQSESIILRYFYLSLSLSTSSAAAAAAAVPIHSKITPLLNPFA